MPAYLVIDTVIGKAQEYGKYKAVPLPAISSSHEKGPDSIWR